MSNDRADDEFQQAMVTLAHWRAKNPEAEVKDEPNDIADCRLSVMRRLASLKEGDIDPWLGRKIEVLIRKSSRYIVYLDDQLDVQWWWTQRLPTEEGLSVVQANVARLTCASAFLLARDDDMSVLRLPRPSRGSDTSSAADERWREYRDKAKGIRSLIAESMAMVLNNVPRTECEVVQAVAEQQILVEKDKICRGFFFWNFFFVILSLAGLAWLLCYLTRRSVGLEVEVATLASVALAGAFGAFVSAMTRTRQLSLEPESGRNGLRVEALSRAAIGAGAAMVAYFALESGLILKAALSNYQDVQEGARYFLGIAAGISERILPSLVGQAETIVGAPPKARRTESV